MPGSPKTRIALSELFICLYFILMFSMRMWGVYESKALYGPLLLLGFGLWGISLLLTEHTLFEWLWIAALMLLAGLVYVSSGEKGLLMYFALMIGMKVANAKRLIKWGAVFGSAGMLVMSFLTAFGFIEDAVYIQKRSFVGDVLRHALGSPHPNTLGTSFTIIAMMVLFYIGHENKKKVWKASAILFAIACYIYLYGQSRTGIAVTTGVLALNIIYTYRRKIGKPEKLVLTLLIPVTVLISVVFPYFFTDETYKKVKALDPTFFVRFRYGHYYFMNNKVTAFGGRLANPDDKLYGIDPSNLQLLLQMGFIAFVLVTCMWALLIYRDVKENRIDELIIVFSLLVMGITDPLLYNISFKNIAFVFIGAALYRYSDKVTEKLPEIFAKKIRIINIKNAFLPAESKESREVIMDGHLLIPCIAAALFLLIAILGYSLTPNPDYVLLDRNTREHTLIKNLEGRTYTRDEIAQIKDEGNLVINYSGEDELMYAYYSREDAPVRGGYYAPNLARMEKVRFWVSVFVWGTAFCAIISRGIWRGKNEKK
ncbi:MAG: hypothetical protein K6G10_09000 [Butyrivibrio sp.]|nr:hypothetical protein [Butyrivibrio sp.]